MDKANVQELDKEILIDLPRVPRPLVHRELRNALVKFCEGSFVLQRTLDPLPVTPNDPHVEFPDLEEGLHYVTVLYARFDEEPLHQASRDELTETYDTILLRRNMRSGHHWGTSRSWETDKAATSRLYLLPRPDLMRLVPIPESTGSFVHVRVAVRPKRANPEIDEWVIERYYEVICDGARARILAIPKKEWTDTALSRDYLARFEAGIESAHGDMTRDFTRNDQVTGRVQSQP
jgi:hypothetical protein